MAATKTGKTITGTKGNDIITGTDGADTLDGALGNDIIRGGRGDDQLKGGGGKDTFVFEKDRATNGLDTILDFASITKSGSQADLLDLSLAVTAKNISANTIGRYVWVFNGFLYVDATGGGIDGGRGVKWAALTGITGGEKINIRTLNYDGPLEVMKFEAPALRLLNDTGSSGTDKITNDPSLAMPTGTLGTVYYSQDNGVTWLPTYSLPTVDGPYTVLAKQVYDGVESPVSSLTFTLDTQMDAPIVSLEVDSGDGSDGADSDSLSNTADLTISPAAEEVTREYSLDGGQTWSSTYDPTALSDGEHTVFVRDTDVAGNSKETSLTFTLDTTADAGQDLAVSFDETAISDSNKGEILLTLAGLDADVGTGSVVVTVTDSKGNQVDASYDLVRGKWVVDGSTLTAGTLTASVHVMDLAGNEADGTSGSVDLGGNVTISEHIFVITKNGSNYAYLDTNGDGKFGDLDMAGQEIGTSQSGSWAWDASIDLSKGAYVVEFLGFLGTPVNLSGFDEDDKVIINFHPTFTKAGVDFDGPYGAMFGATKVNGENLVRNFNWKTQVSTGSVATGKWLSSRRTSNSGFATTTTYSGPLSSLKNTNRYSWAQDAFLKVGIGSPTRSPTRDGLYFNLNNFVGTKLFASGSLAHTANGPGGYGSKGYDPGPWVMFYNTLATGLTNVTAAQVEIVWPASYLIG